MKRIGVAIISLTVCLSIVLSSCHGEGNSSDVEVGEEVVQQAPGKKPLSPIILHDYYYEGSLFDVYIIKADDSLHERFSIYENRSNLSEAEVYKKIVLPENCFLLTASIVDKNCLPLGLFINNGHKVNDLNLRRGEGNFYMGRTGVIVIDSQGGQIMNSLNYQDGLKVDFAIQSGPILLENRKIDPIFDPQSKNLTYRSGVGIFKEKGIDFLVFAKSNTEVSFYKLANLFRSRFQCHDAMTLECGPIVSGFLPYVRYKPRIDVSNCNYIKIKQ